MASTSLLRYGITLSLLLSVLTAGVAGFAYYVQFGAPDRGPPLSQSPLVWQTETLATTLEKKARLIAHHPQTLACFAGKSAACQAQAENLYALDRDTTIHFVKANEQLPQRVLMSSLPAQSHQLADATQATRVAEKPKLAATEPVIGLNGEKQGVVIVEQALPDFPTLFDQLILPRGVGYAELRQDTGSGESSIMRRGDARLASSQPGTIVPLRGTPWKIITWQTADTLFATLLPYITVWLLLSLLQAVLVIGTVLLLRRRIQQNLDTLVALVADVQQQQLRASYFPTLQDFNIPLGILFKIGKQMIGRQVEATTQARLDYLSKVYNRRSFEEKQSELFLNLTEDQKHSLLILDIDHFKQINDTHGHEAGDQMIIAFGKALKDNLRATDFVARLGGDEFCVLFPNTSIERATELSARLREDMPTHINILRGVSHPLSWSGGLSEYHLQDSVENAALARADAALLDAKRAGRNLTRVNPAV